MRAVIYERQGPAHEVLRAVDIPRPDPGPGEVRVRISLSGINPTDWKSRSGATPRAIGEFQIPHHDGAGVIDAVGPGVDQGRVGQRVWLWMAAAGRPWGTAAEWSVVPAYAAVPLPDGASMELGACLGVPALTAHRCLYADGDVDGRTVLVTGGAGAVGHFAIELAKHGGARVVTTVSGAEKAELAGAAGADLVVNYREPDALERIRGFAEWVDRVVEVNIAANLAQDLALAGPGTVVAAYAIDQPDPVLPVRACMAANVTLRFVLLYGVPAADLLRGVEDVSRALAAGALTALPIRRFPLEECAAAQEAVREGAVGKVVLEIG
ncbi:MAG TPA: NADPH:quinone reductase [Candidatus Binatia bacterium]|nr:NADPH:quinone reductase [Candidatus Binatia bacterium]